jgi:hypothetical protein
MFIYTEKWNDNGAVNPNHINSMSGVRWIVRAVSLDPEQIAPFQVWQAPLHYKNV